MLEQLIAAIDTRKKALREVSDALWNNPETAYKEFFAAETASAFLEKCGFSVTRPCYGVETAFRCEFSNGEGPVFAIAAEYDALPEIGHGCGHNLICVAGLAAFLGTAQVMKENNKLCSECGAVLTEENVHNFDGRTMCEDCFNRCTVSCDNCGERIWRDNTEGDSNFQQRWEPEI